jgi:DNA-binding response OmpR family regulator
MKLLIVEDNWVVTDMVEEVASILDINIVGAATNWIDAKKILNADRPDIAIVDINIEGQVDGIEVARHLKEQGIDFIFLTAYKDAKIIKEAVELSPVSYLVKPITPENLMAAFILAEGKQQHHSDGGETKKVYEYTIDNKDVTYNGKTILDLSKGERITLWLLIKNIGHVVSYETFFYETQNDSSIGCEATLRNIVARLRKKCPNLTIKNIKDVGYIATVL